MNKYSKAFIPYLDKFNGFLTENPDEPGDQAHETMASIFMLSILKENWFDGTELKSIYKKASIAFIHFMGLARRTDRLDHWGHYWLCGSGDLYQFVIMAAIEMNDVISVEAIYRGFKERWWLSSNIMLRGVYIDQSEHYRKLTRNNKPHDPRPRFPEPRPEFAALFARAPWRKPNWLVIYFWDLFDLFLSVLQLKYFPTERDRSGNNLGLALRCIFCVRYRSTFISRLALKLLPNDLKLDHHFTGRTPPLNLLWNDLAKGLT
jgi:hypothetical protein